MMRWDLSFTVFEGQGLLKLPAEIKIITVWPGGTRIVLQDMDARLGFNLTADDAQAWAKALNEAAGALNVQGTKA